MTKKCAWLVPLLLVLVTLSGCGRGPRLVPVTGTVKLDGKPLADAAVQFDFGQFPRPAIGRTDAEGKFSLAYLNRAGAPIGSCKVNIRKQAPAGASGLKELVPEKYNSKSQLLYEITKKGPNDFNFDLNSEPNSGGDQAQPPAPDSPEEPNDDDAEENRPQAKPPVNAPAAEGDGDDDGGETDEDGS